MVSDKYTCNFFSVNQLVIDNNFVVVSLLKLFVLVVEPDVR